MTHWGVYTSTKRHKSDPFVTVWGQKNTAIKTAPTPSQPVDILELFSDTGTYINLSTGQYMAP